MTEDTSNTTQHIHSSRLTAQSTHSSQESSTAYAIADATADMSNIHCAELYSTIIDEVILESRQDFENAGIDEQTLQDLRDIWRQRLSATKVASFPWSNEYGDEDGGENDEQEQEHNENQNVNENENAATGITTADGTTPPEFAEDYSDDAIKVKPEELDNVFLDTEDGAHAQSEAAASAVGIPASGSLAVADQLSLPHMNQNDGGIDFGTDRTTQLQQDTDVTLTISRNQLDGGGYNLQIGAGNDDDDDDDDLGSDLGADSDAINSDLDDSDDEDSDDENEGGEGDHGGANGDNDENNDIEKNIMLCLYDRVQRVRNRWKCSLKDGVMNINGKDYVFQKASGDSEW